MSTDPEYIIVRVDDDHFRLDRTTPPGAGPVAFAVRLRNRHGGAMGWHLRPLFIMQGSKSRICATAAEVLASTKLVTPGAARRMTNEPQGAAPRTRRFGR